MDLAVSVARAFQKWIDHNNPKHMVSDDALKREALEAELNDYLLSPRAFATRGDPVGMRNVADYSDGWTKSKAGEFNVYYICMAGSSTPCCTFIESMQWDRLMDTPHALNQRWCCHCGARYNTLRGVRCDTIMGNKALYNKVDITPPPLQDAK